MKEFCSKFQRKASEYQKKKKKCHHQKQNVILLFLLWTWSKYLDILLVSILTLSMYMLTGENLFEWDDVWKHGFVVLTIWKYFTHTY